MAESEDNKSNPIQQPAYKERKIANPAESLQQSTSKLAKQGGFDLIEASIDGVQNLNPEKKRGRKYS